MFIRKVVNALSQHRVRYALVGGYAVALHGVVRGTVDVDIAIALDRNTYRRAERALSSIGLESTLPVTAEQVFDYRREYINNRNLIAWSFRNPDNLLEMVDIVITEDVKAIKTVTRSAYGLRLRIAAIDDLIEIKRKANRRQDREDIKALEKVEMKAVQYFSNDYLEQCKSFSTEAILDYLESFRLLQQCNDKSRLISIKVPESLLSAFRAKASLHQMRYQTQIKNLMTEWVMSKDA